MEFPTRAARAAINPGSVFLRPLLEKMIEAIVLEEAAIREAGGQLPMDEKERQALRNMVLFRICAESPPAGNA